jgi:2-aminoethylphosphonate transport system permease protein
VTAAASERAAPALPGAKAMWVVPPLLLVALLFAYPLALILRQALTGDGDAASLDHFAQVIGTRAFHNALLNTVEIAVAATAGCLLTGLALALLLSFVPFPGSGLVARLIDTVIALPTFLYGSAGMLNAGLVETFGLSAPPVDFLYSPWGVILAEVTVYTPFVMRPLMAAFSLVDRAQIEVASSLGARPARIVRQVILPAALPALLAGGSLCLLLTVNEFGIVLFIGAKGVITLPLLVYDKAIQEFDYTTACVIAVINVVLSLGLFALYRLVIGRLGGRHAAVV